MASASGTSPTCCVIGATGFVGSYVTRELLGRGYFVRATCRDPSKGQWLRDLSPNNKSEERLEIHALTLGPEGVVLDKEGKNPLDDLVVGCQGVFLCAGYEKQEPETIDFMVNAAQAVLRAAEKAAAEKQQICVVLTSSTGSTNPPGAAGDAVKNELDFWSDPDTQRTNNRFSPAAKTLMEIHALKFLGRNKQNEMTEVTNETSQRNASIRLCIDCVECVGVIT
jgi:nucleoside-diphosphate-sugar epimerase